MMTTLLSAAAAAYFWLEPRNSFRVADAGDSVALGIFVLLGAVLSGLFEGWRRATEVATQAEAERLTLLESEQRVRAELERASRLKDQFLSVLSHELRTPLSATLSWVHLLKIGALAPEKTAHAIEAIERSALAEARLVESLLDLSRIMAGKLEVQRKPVDLASVMHAAADALRPVAQANQLSLTVSVPASAVYAMGDADRLQQVVWNLVSNSIKFTPSGGHVVVELRAAEGHAQLHVRDDGQGIAADFLPYIFDRFTQAESDRTRGQLGFGLGLAIVRELVQAHGGTVAARSLGPGRGSAFSVTLPMGDAPGATGSEASPSEAFAAIGEVDDASDLLIADIGMPGEDGYSLIRKVRARERERRRPRVPALALTAYASPGDQDRALEAGFDGHLAKPAAAGDLLRTLGRLGFGK